MLTWVEFPWTVWALHEFFCILLRYLNGKCLDFLSVSSVIFKLLHFLWDSNSLKKWFMLLFPFSLFIFLLITFLNWSLWDLPLLSLFLITWLMVLLMQLTKLNKILSTSYYLPFISRHQKVFFLSEKRMFTHASRYVNYQTSYYNKHIGLYYQHDCGR